ncbi:MAG TPA: T9SS type A sorting domain-containing protein [Bacteroidales bacterium]|nr:T9SS type A sorting domain-containing protein [Bacteroidales bacterium]
MKKLLIIIIALIQGYIGYSQSVFNNVYYYENGNISSSAIPIGSDFVALNGTTVGDLRGFVFTMLDSNGTILWNKSYGNELFDLYEGLPGCLTLDTIANQFYLTGVVVNISTLDRIPFLAIFDDALDSLYFKIIDVDSVFGAYDITKFNDSIYGIVTANTIPDDYEMGLLVYDVNNDSILYHCGYGSETIPSNEVGNEIILTRSRNYLLGGFTFGFSTSTYKQDWYLVKTDSIGNMLWERYYGNPLENDGRIMAMLESKDSAYIVAGGQAICNWSMNPISEAALRKIDTAGNLVWERFYRRYDYNSTGEEVRYSNMYISDIIELGDGNFVSLMDYERSTGPGGNYRIRLLKTNCNGEILFSRTLKNTNIEFTQDLYSSSIKQTSDNGFIINGYGDYTWDYDPPQQFFLIKTDSLGCEGELYPAPPTENVECPDLPDTMYCDGTYNSRLRVQGKSAPYTLEFSTGETIENLYYPPVFIPKSLGTGSFTVHVGVATYNHSYDTATLFNPIPAEDMEPDIIELPFSLNIPENYFGPDLKVTITNGFGESYEITLPVYVDCNVSSEPLSETAAIQVYPNPATDYLQIQLPDENETSFVKILNLQGQTVLVQPLQSQTTRLDISDLAPGTYMVRLYYGHRIENVRVEKQ